MRAVDLAARQHADDPPVLDHRKALEAVAAHALRGVGDGVAGRQGLRRAVGHDLPDGDGGADVALQQVDQRLEHAAQRAVADQRGARRGCDRRRPMPPAILPTSIASLVLRATSWM